MRFRLIPGLLILSFLVSCFGSKDFVVESDYSYYGKFKNYSTYAFIDQQHFDLDTLIPDLMIQKAINHRMSLLGYKQDDKKPNLLIGYKIFFSDFNFKGWNQPELEDWLKKQGFIEEDINRINYKLKEGTLMILMVDRKQKKAVWQGYNSGLIDTNVLDNERFVRGTVRTIFDEYKIFARGFLKDS